MRHIKVLGIIGAGLLGASVAQAANPNDFIVYNYDWGSDGLLNNGSGSVGGQNGRNLMGRLYVPTNYDPSKSYPIYLFMAGLGEAGVSHYIQTNNPANTATYYVSDNTSQVNGNIDALLANAKSRDFFLYAPQSNAGWWSEVPAAVNMIAKVADQYNIDYTRMYATGLSAGAQGTFNAAAQFTDVFAGFAPLSTHGKLGSADASKLVGKPMWFYQAVDDTAYNARDSVNNIRTSGGLPTINFDTYTGHGDPAGTNYSPNYTDGSKYLAENNLRYSEYSSGGHSNVVWQRAYNTSQMYDWFDSKPSTLTTLQPGRTAYFGMGTAGGVDSHGRTWNGANGYGSQFTLEVASPFGSDATGVRTTVSLAVSDDFYSNSATAGTTGVPGYDSANTGGSWSISRWQNNGQGQLKLMGLVPGQLYDLSLFAGLPGGGGIGLTRYSVGTQDGNAGTDQYIDFNPSNNTTQFMDFANIPADASGHIYIKLSLPISGGGWGNYGYLNFFSITAVPEPATLSLLLLAPVALGRRKRPAG